MQTILGPSAERKKCHAFGRREREGLRFGTVPGERHIVRISTLNVEEATCSEGPTIGRRVLSVSAASHQQAVKGSHDDTDVHIT